MLETSIGFACIFIVGELIALIIFSMLRRAFDILPQRDLFATSETSPAKIPGVEIFKGVLERLVVTFGLFISLPGILTVFAALKLANRLGHEDDDSDRTKNYFLIGNLLTILLCLAYYQLASVFAGDLGAALINQIGDPNA